MLTGENYFSHLNSVDKDSRGDYLVSARFTDTIYKISGENSSIIWQLGGDHSSFVLNEFNFSKQHDARFVEQNATTTIISFLDNASDGVNTTSTHSSALLVALESSITPMVARVIRRWIRPDGGLSSLRGNFQLLANGNAFVGWSDNSYISEHTFDGVLLMEAQFMSRRFVTYRAYKFNFTGTPVEPIMFKAYAFGTTPATSTTVCYVSWNGATEVAVWEFHGRKDATTQSGLIGRTLKKGFETVFQFTGFEKSISATAISADGQVLGRSATEATILPKDWQSTQPVDGLPDLSVQLDDSGELKSWVKGHKQEL